MALTQQWKCQDNAASTTVVATVGTNATLAGGDNTSAITTTGPGTALTAALDLDGTNDYIDVSGAAVSFASGSAWSVAAWVKFDTVALHAILGITGANTTRFAIQSSFTTIRVNLNSSTNRDFTIPASTNNVWYHLLVTRNTSNALRLFWDGTESSTGAITVAESFAPTVIGRYNTFRMNGRVCDVRAYDSDESANVFGIMAEKNTAVIGPRVMHHRRMMGAG